MVYNCRFCSKNHQRNSCPAYGKMYSHCKKKNNFKVACEKRKRELNHNTSTKVSEIHNREDLEPNVTISNITIKEEWDSL